MLERGFTIIMKAGRKDGFKGFALGGAWVNVSFTGGNEYKCIGESAGGLVHWCAYKKTQGEALAWAAMVLGEGDEA